jgi:hypothetical protein
MNDPWMLLYRLIPIFCVPMAILAPLAIVLIVPNRATDDAQILKARSLTLILAVCTLAALLLATGLWVLFLRNPASFWMLNACTFLFFPLWFLLAMPVLAAKNPLSNNPDKDEPVRTASLVPRQQLNPVPPSLQIIPWIVIGLFFLAIAARGLAPFPLHADSSQPQLSAQQQYTQWLGFLICFGAMAVGWLFMVPMIQRMALMEPEPMDAKGSQELSDLYREHRQHRVRGLFWLLAVGTPLLMGLAFSSTVWLPDLQRQVGLVFGLLGSLVGVAGAIFGSRMTMERMKIAEAKQRLSQEGANP